ncbi:MAG TPA: hypothetical protein VF659_24190 [Pyrinomonadaceae bacterium]|jgi:hypothetical protein
MTTKKKTQAGAKGKAEGSSRRKEPPTLAEASAQTARHLAALLNDRRLPSGVRAALAAEVNDFAALAGGVTGPAVLPAAYPVMCAALGYDGLAATVAAVRKPEPPPSEEEPEFYFNPDGHALRDVDGGKLRAHGADLAHWRIFEGDTIQYETAARIKGNRHARQIQSGDLIVLQVRKPRAGEPDVLIGEARFEPGKVVLVSHVPGRERRAFDVRAVLVLGRVTQVWRRVYIRPHYDEGDE